MSETTHIGEMLVGSIEAVRTLHDAYLRRKAAVIPQLCGPCAFDSAGMRACLFSGDEECKHAAGLAARSRLRDRLSRMSAGGVPRKFWDEVDKVESCEALNAIRRLLSGQTSIAILLGTTGAGKSLCSGYAIAERGGVFAPASGLAGSEERVDVLLGAVQSAPLAALDDVGRARSATPAAIERTEDVICNRYDRGLPTILTANLLPWRSSETSPPGFWDLFGGEHGRIADRLGGTDRVTICTERSRRRNPAHFTERDE